MKTKLVPLAFLIPAVVLAQPAPQAPAPQPPQAGMMQKPQVNLTNPIGAADALNNAKKKTKELSTSDNAYGCTEWSDNFSDGC